MGALNVAEGLLFSKDLSRVVLIVKGRPEYLKGQLLGVGGKLEPGETPVEAISREFWEEAGVRIREPDWKHVLTYDGDRDQNISLFMAIGDVDAVKSITDEAVIVVEVNALPSMTNRTTRWAIPMCLDAHVMDRTRNIRFPITDL